MFKTVKKIINWIGYDLVKVRAYEEETYWHIKSGFPNKVIYLTESAVEGLSCRYTDNTVAGEPTESEFIELSCIDQSEGCKTYIKKL